MSDFEKNGYLILDDFITAPEILKLRSRAHELVAGFTGEDQRSVFHSFFDSGEKDDYIMRSAENIHFFLEESEKFAVCKIGHAMHDLDAVFSAFSRSPKLKDLALQLGFRDPLLAQSMYFFKHPFISGEIGLHQDASFIYTNPSSVVGLWFALEEATTENSCLWVLPEGHREALRNKFVSDEQGARFVQFNHPPFLEEDFIPLEVKQGSVIVLHGQLPHFSRANRSSKSREAYTLHLIEGDATYPKENWLQRSQALPFKGF